MQATLLVLIAVLTGAGLLVLVTKPLSVSEWKPVLYGNRLTMRRSVGNKPEVRSPTHDEEQNYINDQASF